MPFLTQDIISYRGYQYGHEGESVEIVADHGNVVIVQNASGDRYSCKKELLTETAPPKDEQKASEPESLPVDKGKKQNKKAGQATQPGLFG